MNKAVSRIIAETIIDEEIRQMFDNAEREIIDWREASSVNKNITKGASWNILKPCSTNDASLQSHLVKTNMIREFGDYLPVHLLPEKKTRKAKKTPGNLYHEDPKLDL